MTWDFRGFTRPNSFEYHENQTVLSVSSVAQKKVKNKSTKALKKWKSQKLNKTYETNKTPKGFESEQQVIKNLQLDLVKLLVQRI